MRGKLTEHVSKTFPQIIPQALVELAHPFRVRLELERDSASGAGLNFSLRHCEKVCQGDKNRLYLPLAARCQTKSKLILESLGGWGGSRQDTHFATADHGPGQGYSAIDDCIIQVTDAQQFRGIKLDTFGFGHGAQVCLNSHQSPRAIHQVNAKNVICFILTHGREYTLRAIQKTSPELEVRLLTYDQLIRARKLPRATYVFTDLDRLSYFDLELAACIYRQLKAEGLRVLNDPAVVNKRYRLLRILHAAGLNDFNAYLAEELPPQIRFPVFIRKTQGHGVPATELLEDRESVDRHLCHLVRDGVPLENLIVIEYAGEPVAPGIYRKFGLFKIGESFTPFICGHDRKWMVKIGQKGIAGEDLYREEARIVRENPFVEHFRKVFELANIDYGRADFGFYRGRIQVFEINTNPTIGVIAPHPSATRRDTMVSVIQNLLTAFAKMDSQPGPALRLPRDIRLNRFRRWSAHFTQSRIVD